MNRDRILVFADDWGRHPSSCQHLIKRLMDRYSVTWVNTIGTRTPQFDLATIRRGFGKVKQWFSRSPAKHERATAASQLNVLNPRMWPWFTRKIDRWLNRKLLLRRLLPVVDAAQPAIAVTTIPIVADLMGPLPVRRWVYYCVDDFSKWPGLDRKTMARMERIVVERADAIVTVSEELRDRIGRMGRESELITHGVDVRFWQADCVTPTIFENVELPLIVFWGVVDRRMDVSFLRELSARMSSGSIVLVGPENDPDPELKRLPRVVHVGPVDYETLPSIARDASVLVMPYADLPVTRAMQPLKLKEYLATDKPVVVRDLPATCDWSDCLDPTTNPASFAITVLNRIATGLPANQRQARQRLLDESWESKAATFEDVLFSQEVCLNTETEH